MRLPLLDAGGATIGRIEDIVIVPSRADTPPRVVGYVATSQRRRIFVNGTRFSSIDGDGARLRSWDVDLHPFKVNGQRDGHTVKLWAQDHEGWLTMDAVATLRD